jgi:hypothetical protein
MERQRFHPGHLTASGTGHTYPPDSRRWPCPSLRRAGVPKCAGREKRNADASDKYLESDRERAPRRRRHAASDRRSWRAVQSFVPVQAYRGRLGQFEKWNVTGGNAAAVAAVLPPRASCSMTLRPWGFDGPWKDETR